MSVDWRSQLTRESTRRCRRLSTRCLSKADGLLSLRSPKWTSPCSRACGSPRPCTLVGGRAIELRMSAENFRITNPGGLYEVSIIALGRIDLTSARNRRLIDLCRYVQTTDGRVVEALATGIPTVFAELTKAGLPAPRFLDNGISFIAIIDTRQQEIPSSAPTQVNDVPPALQAVLDVLADSSADVNEISHRLNATAASVAKRLQRLKRLGLIVSDGGSGRHTTYHRSEQAQIDTTGSV